MELAPKIAQQLGLTLGQVQAALDLFAEGCTVPFVARYRKERTGGLDEVQLRDVQKSSERLTQLEQRRQSILSSLAEQGITDKSLIDAVRGAQELVALEDLYAPYRPKRKTRASKAIDAGLEPLLEQLLREADIDKLAKNYICDEFGDVEAVISGVKDIYAERVSDHAQVRDYTRQQLKRRGKLISKKRRGAEENPTFEVYLDFECQLERLRPHQVLALRRGDAEKAISYSFEAEDERILEWIKRRFNKANKPRVIKLLDEAIDDGYRRLLIPAMSRDVWAELEEQADKHAIEVFALNLKNLLLQPPLTHKRVLGVDPGYRTGCKIAVVDEQGQLLTTDMIYIHDSRSKTAQSRLETLIERYKVELVAIGNGTASRETEEVVAAAVRGFKDVQYAMVNEAGASVYSASELARQELPELDVSYRGAVSIARRLQDPLAELVKIDPRSIGVGLYQHDVNQAELERSLSAVVEDVVNAVGVDVNTASAALLTYISGIGPKLAARIVEHRNAQGAYQSRASLKKIKGLGEKTFEQCAGFLRIREGAEVLDNTAIHPENYKLARAILSALSAQPGASLAKKLEADQRKVEALASAHGVGALTLTDILDDLVKPGRDPREALDAPQLRSDVMGLDDLQEGMRLVGTVRNVVDFGAFVDIGVKQDGLIHISELSNQFVRSPHDVVALGDRVEVVVLSVDHKRGRIALSRRQAL